MTGASSFSGIIDYTIGGTGATGGSTGSTGATALFKNLLYLADCKYCGPKIEPKYDADGRRIDGTEPTGATGWYFGIPGSSGSSGSSGASYGGPDYTIGGTGATNVLPPNRWGQNTGGVSNIIDSYDPSIPPTIVIDKYQDCMTCGCPISHKENTDWSCEIEIEIRYPSNTRFQPIEMVIVQNYQQAYEEMLPNLTSVLPKINEVQSIYDFLRKMPNGSSGVIGASAPVGSSGPSGSYGSTGYYIIDGSGKIVGATGSSTFTSAAANLVSDYRIPMTKGQIEQLENNAGKLEEEIYELLGIPKKHGYYYYGRQDFCKYDRITKKRTVFEVSGDCDGPDNNTDSWTSCPPEDAYSCHGYMPGPQDGDSEGNIDWWWYEYYYVFQMLEHSGDNVVWSSEEGGCDKISFLKWCCCTDCLKTYNLEVEKYRDGETDYCTGIYKFVEDTNKCKDVYDWYYAKRPIKKITKRVTLTAEDVTCFNGACEVFYLLKPTTPVEDTMCLFPGHVHIKIPQTETEATTSKDPKYIRLYVDDDHTGSFTYRIQGIRNNFCELPSFTLGKLCGTKENPDREIGANKNTYQYDYTLDNTKYP